jgi:hypothetical protein
MGKPKARRNRKSTALNKENEKAHRKAKPADYTVSDILDRAESCLDECELQLAQKFCQRALEMDNDNLRALQLREGGLKINDEMSEGHCVVVAAFFTSRALALS